METLYERLGEDTVRALVERFYDVMDEAPEAAEVRAMHPEDLASSREKLTLFLIGWTGGPPVYVERHGHPRLRARHLPFAIGVAARDQWMMCMERALAEVVADPLARESLAGAFRRMADHMRNVEG